MALNRGRGPKEGAWLGRGDAEQEVRLVLF